MKEHIARFIQILALSLGAYKNNVISTKLKATLCPSVAIFGFQNICQLIVLFKNKKMLNQLLNLIPSFIHSFIYSRIYCNTLSLITLKGMVPSPDITGRHQEPPSLTCRQRAVIQCRPIMHICVHMSGPPGPLIDKWRSQLRRNKR